MVQKGAVYALLCTGAERRLSSSQVETQRWTLRALADLFCLSDEDRADLYSSPEAEVLCDIWTVSGSQTLLFARLPSALTISLFGLDEEPCGYLKEKPLWTVWLSTVPGSHPDDPLYTIKGCQVFSSRIDFTPRDGKFSEDSVAGLFGAAAQSMRDGYTFAMKEPINGEYEIVSDTTTRLPAP